MSDYRIARRTLLRTAGAGIAGGTLATSTGAAADDAAGYSFLEVDQISEGEVANVTIGVDGSSTATVVLGDDQDGHVSAVELEGIESEELVLQYDLSAANDADDEFGWSVRGDADATIAGVSVDTRLEEDRSLPAHTWDLSIGEGLDDSDGTYAVDEAYDRDVLVVTDRVEVGDYEPADTTGDGLYNDFTGNGETTHDDVEAFFEHIDDDAVQNNPEKFDFDDDGTIGYSDVVELLRQV